jgi:hypothetical protein
MVVLSQRLWPFGRATLRRINDGALDFMPSGGRTPADPQIERDQLRFIKDEVDTMLLGRTTYQIFIDYWPTATTDNEIIADD